MRRLLIPIVIVSCGVVPLFAGEWEELVAALPDMTSEPITNGFVIYDCEYIPPPYVVSRIGTTFYINGRSAGLRDLSYVFVEETSLPHVEKLPDIPGELTPTSRVFDAACCQYYREVLSFYTNRGFSGTNLSAKVAVEAAHLPNVFHAYSAGAGAIFLEGSGGENNSRGIWSWDTPYEKSRRRMLRDYYRSGGLLDEVTNEYNKIVGSLSSGKIWYGGRSGVTLGVSRDSCARMFAAFLKLLDEGMSEEEIIAEKASTKDTDFAVFTNDEITNLIAHKDCWTAEFRRRMFGEYWQTYGVKPETEEERIERLYRGVTYEERTAESFSNRLESLEYNTKLQYGAETNKWPEADIESVDRFRREYAEHVAERDAAWAALSESDRAIIRARIDKEKSDAEAEKQRKILEKADARIAEMKSAIVAEMKAASNQTLTDEQIDMIAQEKAKQKYVLTAAMNYRTVRRDGIDAYPATLHVLISAVCKGRNLLVGGERYVTDRWGKIYRYRAVADGNRWNLLIESAGPDGVFDTSDDIVTCKNTNRGIQ